MKFIFEKLGLLDRAEIELADLTLICGENNTGKTYVTYAIYGFLRSWRKILHYIMQKDVINLLQEDGKFRFDLNQIFSEGIEDYLNRLGDVYVNGLFRAFATDESSFKNTKCKILSTSKFDITTRDYQRQVKSGPGGKVLATISKEKNSSILEVLVADTEFLDHRSVGLADFVIDAIADIVFAPHFPDYHISSAERTGAAIFRNELDIARSRMLDALNQMDSKELRRNPLKILRTMDTGYPWPVEDNVDFVRQLEDLEKRTGAIAENNQEILEFFDEMLGGSYKVIKRKLVFQEKGGARQKFSMNESSSCIRALLDVYFYLRCKAKPGDLFIIDEPELNLHPKTQRSFARLVARLINSGVKVFITTHSDYMIKEFNTLIMLNQNTDHARKVQNKHKYDSSELLEFDRIRLYMTTRETCAGSGRGRRPRVRTLKPAKITPTHGIEAPTFDKTIDLMNEIQDELMFGGDI
jgi:hypothetical protein